MVKELTDVQLKEEIGKDTPIIVDFWASWCGPCKRLAPIFEEVSKLFEGKLTFAKISTEDYGEVAGEHGIMGIPCLILFSKGKEVDRIVGVLEKDALKAKIDEILAKA